ncbi:MAG: hypothetical protein QJR14_06245 [Bacillota bacterium]|nr:hypothetical protein [Bacillota bacterium]
MAEAKGGRNLRDEARREAERRGRQGAPEEARRAAARDALSDADLRAAATSERGAADETAQAGWVSSAATDAASDAIHPGAPGTSRQAYPRYGNSPYDRAGKAGQAAAEADEENT